VFAGLLERHTLAVKEDSMKSGERRVERRVEKM
jgi:hypothetical protein